MLDGIEGGELVLVRGRLAQNGRTVMMARGIELRTAGLEIVTVVPEVCLPEGNPAPALLMFFSSEAEREDFAAAVRAEAPDVVTLGI